MATAAGVAVAMAGESVPLAPAAAGAPRLARLRAGIQVGRNCSPRGCSCCGTCWARSTLAGCCSTSHMVPNARPDIRMQSRGWGAVEVMARRKMPAVEAAEGSTKGARTSPCSRRPRTPDAHSHTCGNRTGSPSLHTCFQRTCTRSPSSRSSRSRIRWHRSRLAPVEETGAATCCSRHNSVASDPAFSWKALAGAREPRTTAYTRLTAAGGSPPQRCDSHQISYSCTSRINRREG